MASPCSTRTRKGTRRSLMGELTRWQPMVSLYTYFTDCPRKEGGPSTGSVSQYESARDAENLLSKARRKILQLCVKAPCTKCYNQQC